ncbi:MAG TPA: phosphoribosyltransferase family protein [Micromonosporaceae bacterium]
MTATGLWGDLADLVLPVDCAGCGASARPLRLGFCVDCMAVLAALDPRSVRPDPVPPGLPPCTALGGYDGALREALLSYKERGRHRLARPLGRLLADVVVRAVGPEPVLLVPVPATGRAARQRHGDHLRRLTSYAAGRLRAAGHAAVVVHPLRALPRADSTALDRTARAAAAAHAFQLRPGRIPALRRLVPGRSVVVLDDIVTTGATLASVANLLRAAGVPVATAAVLAATELRHAP